MSSSPASSEYRLDALCEIQSSGSWGEDPDGGADCMKVIRASDIDDAGNILFDRLPLRKLPKSSNGRFLCQSGDILVVKSSGSHTNVVTGKTAFVANVDGPLAFTNFLLRARPNRSLVEPEFLLFCLRSPSILARIRTMVATATYPNLKVPEFKALTLRVPALDEQRRVVSVARECLQRNEEIVRLRRQVAEERAELRSSLVEAELAELHGKDVSLADVCKITSPLIDPRESMYQSMLHVGGANIESKTGRLIELKTVASENLKSAKFVFDPSMVLYNKIRPYLVKVARPEFSGLCSADMYPLWPEPSLLTRDFLFYLLLSRRFTEYAIAGSNRAGMPKVNREHLFAYRFKLPPLNVQRVVCERLDEALDSVVRMAAEMDATEEEFAELSGSILGRAAAGVL